MTWRGSVSQASSVVQLANVVSYIGSSSMPARSAIDTFYFSSEPVLVGVNPDYFSNYPEQVSGLLYIGLISSTENYFRNILGMILEVCPVARQKAAEEKVQLGSYLWSGPGIHSRTAFDFIAFSSGKNVTETFNKFIGYQVKQHGVWKAMLVEYDKLCEIRHGIVHSGLVLSGKNALKLGLLPSSSSMQVNPTYATVQEAGEICTTLVQAANNELFELMVERWAGEWRQLPSWQASRQGQLFGRIFRGFFSVRDQARGAIANSISLETLQRRVKREYGV